MLVEDKDDGMIPIDDPRSRSEKGHSFYLPVKAKKIILTVYKHLKEMDKKEAPIKKKLND